MVWPVFGSSMYAYCTRAVEAHALHQTSSRRPPPDFASVGGPGGQRLRQSRLVHLSPAGPRQTRAFGGAQIVSDGASADPERPRQSVGDSGWRRASDATSVTRRFGVLHACLIGFPPQDKMEAIIQPLELSLQRSNPIVRTDFTAAPQTVHLPGEIGVHLPVKEPDGLIRESIFFYTKTKRVRPSHKPHPKATCPHPT